MDHHGIVVDGRTYLVECEVLGKDDRSRECSIITLFYEHSLGIEIDRRMLAFSGDRENVA